ncbi:dermonecrotic toxin domain-containing protein [Pseudomonas massiliensis]|uniref:dermonecrotic toxin domain-containing protein n=1 Tax=Pseudomonas massiliensis TaxID=522492 RepID=UPI00058DD834|nr:DUF6543 domain-containing protein [Pseudomonas massiliensis]
MSQPSSLFQMLSDNASLSGEAMQRFKDQPTLEDTAAQLVAQVLSRLTPPLEQGPWDIALGWPIETSTTGEPEHLRLPRLLIQLFVSQTPLTVVPGYQMALQKQGDRWVPLSMNLQRFAEELDAVRPWLMQAHWEALCRYWSEFDGHGATPWQWMADYLRRAYRRELDLAHAQHRITHEAIEVALSLVGDVEGDLPAGAAPARGLLMHIMNGSQAMPYDVRLDPHLLVILPMSDSRESYLLFSPNAGLRYFLQAHGLKAFLDARLAEDGILERVRFQVLEPEGDLFVALARTLLQTQLLQLDSVTERVRASVSAGAPEWLEWSSDALTGFFQLDGHAQAAQVRRLQAMLPDWLRRARLADRWRYGKALLQLTQADILSGHAWFLEGIPTIEAYALDRLRTVAARAYPGQQSLEPENIRLSLEHVVPDPTAVAGGPARTEIITEPLALTALLIDNLAAHSGAWLQVSAKPGTTLPAWLNGDVMRDLVQRADVGGQYPKLLRESLLEGPGAAKRKAAFVDQIRLQLPLLAQELVLRQACDMDNDGAHLVFSGLDMDPASNPGRMMRLGVTAGDAYGVDAIAVTYVFVATEQSGGPCVLYRPLHAQPLRQFCSLDALLEDLAAPGEVQDDALRWMTDLGRARYSHGGVREPRVARFGQGSEFAPVETGAPARLVLTPMAPPVLDSLYAQVVEALISVAEQRSVSNAENFWISLSQLGWTLFNGLLPIMNGPLATAGWLFQLSEAFVRFLEAEAKPTSERDGARRDLLLTVVMLLLSEAIRWPGDEELGAVGDEPGTSAPREETDDTQEVPGLQEVPAPSVEQTFFEPGPLPRLSELAVSETVGVPTAMGFELGWASPELSLSATQRQALRRLRVTASIGTPALVPHGPTKDLYLSSDRLLVKWGQDFFTVNFDPEPRIVGPQGEPGPYLRRDEAGRWILDTRLHLRGGGPKRRIEARRQQNMQVRLAGEQLYHQAVEEFDSLLEMTNPLANELDNRTEAGEALVEEREKLHALFDEGYRRMEARLKEYKGLQEQTPLPDFADRACGLLGRLLSTSKAITNNLSELNRAYVLSSPFVRAQEEELNRVIDEDLPAWQQFLERQAENSQRELDYVLAHQETIAEIKTFPGLGARALKQNEGIVPLEHSALDLYANQVYCRIGIIIEPVRGLPDLSRQMQDALEPALICAESHSRVVDRPEVSREESIQVFDTAISEYQRAEDALALLEQTLEPQFQSSAMGKLRNTLAALVSDAESRLGDLLRETMVDMPQGNDSHLQGAARVPQAIRPTSSRRRKGKQPSRPPKGAGKSKGQAGSAATQLQVIHTVDGQALMAEVRTDIQSGTRTASVTSNNQVVATWHPDPETGLWAKPVRRKPVAPERVEQLGTCMREAERALATARKEIVQINRLKRVTRIPADLEDQFHNRARQLEEAAEHIDRALTRLNETDAAIDRQSAELKARQLREEARRARSLGTEARIELTLNLPPTPGRLQFLVNQGRATIHRLGKRVPLKRAGRRDFVQEYEIRDSTGHSLWYAHFHYDTMTAPADGYTAAHLKTPTQRFDGYHKQLEQARNDQEVVSIYRSRIEPNLARTLFLSLL